MPALILGPLWRQSRGQVKVRSRSSAMRCRQSLPSTVSFRKEGEQSRSWAQKPALRREVIVKKIGIMFGMENTFPPALVEKINNMTVEDVKAEFVKLGGVKMADPSGYRVIIDRISQDIPFYRAYLKNAALTGTIVINNPFWWSADDKFFNYALASKLGVAIPPTVILPHHRHPEGTTDQSMRNLEYPLNWDAVFRYVGFPAFLKPHDGGGWRNVSKVSSPEEFFAAYNDS